MHKINVNKVIKNPPNFNLDLIKQFSLLYKSTNMISAKIEIVNEESFMRKFVYHG